MPEDYLKTWRSINQAGGPTEPIRSHYPRTTAKIGPNKGLSRLDTEISEPEPLADSNIAKIIMNRLPGVKTAMDLASDPGNLFGGPIDEATKAISWFGTKAARQASGDNLIKLLRSRHAEGTPMRDAVEKAYANYPRTFAHISDIDNSVSKRSYRGEHGTETYPKQKFLDTHIFDEAGDPAGTVPKLKTTRESRLTSDEEMDEFIKGNSFTNPRGMAIDNRVGIRPDVIDTPQGEITFRHELNHVAQNIRRPYEHPNDVIAGRGQIKGIHDSGTNLPSLDYMLEPVEVGARVGQERGLDKGRVREIIDPMLGYDSTKPVSHNAKISHKKHADIINAELDRVINDYKTMTGYAFDKPIYDAYAAGKGIGKKTYPSKGDLAKSEPKVLAAAIKKINDHVLPHFNKARPASDPLVFTLNGTVVPKIEGMLKNPEKLGDFIRQIRVQRLSQVK